MRATRPPVRLRRLLLCLAVVIGLAAAACGNSGDDDDAGDGTTSTTQGGTDTDAGSGEKVDITGVPGVTDDEIRYAAFGTNSQNPLGTCVLDCFVSGINAYFAYRNDQGGIYGRKLVISETLDDELSKNQQRALEITSANDTFGAFSATQVASGWQDITKAGMPLYVWNIHPVESTDPAVFGNAGALCTTCTSRAIAYVAKQAKAKKIGILGYGISENSKLAAEGSAGLDREVQRRDRRRRGGVLQQRRRLRDAERHRARGHGDEAGRRRHGVRHHRPQRHEDDRPGDAAPGHRRRADVPPEHLRPGLREGGRRPVRGRLRGGRLPSLRGRAAGAGSTRSRSGWARPTRRSTSSP